MPENEAEKYFKQLLIEVRTIIIEMLKTDERVKQETFLQRLHNLIDLKPQLAEMARESGYEEAWFFVFGALIQLMSEGVILFDEDNKYYILNVK